MWLWEQRTEYVPGMWRLVLVAVCGLGCGVHEEGELGRERCDMIRRTIGEIPWEAVPPTGEWYALDIGDSRFLRSFRVVGSGGEIHAKVIGGVRCARSPTRGNVMECRVGSGVGSAWVGLCDQSMPYEID